MNIRNAVSVASVFAALAVPISSQAATDQDAVAACSEALAKMIESKQGVAPKVSIGNSGASSSYRLYTDAIYHLDAVEPKSERVVARADCVVNRNAKVRFLRTLPLTAKDARGRSQGRSLLVSES